MVSARSSSDAFFRISATSAKDPHAKGAIPRQAAGRGYQYELPGGPDAAQASMTAHRMLRLLDAGADRAGVLSRFVADLRPEDEELLTSLLAETGGPDQGEEPDRA